MHVAVRAELSLVAVMTAVPSDTAMTLPLGSTLATLSSLEVHEAPVMVGLPGL